MSTYAIVSALIFAIVAVGHAIRLVNLGRSGRALFGADVRIVDFGLVIAALIPVWGFTQLAH